MKIEEGRLAPFVPGGVACTVVGGYWVIEVVLAVVFRDSSIVASFRVTVE